MDQDTPQLETWLLHILDRDAAAFENAYWGVRPDAALAVTRLLQLLPATQDAYSRGKILELLGESGDLSVAEIISADLTHPEPQVRE